jgi:hypothetical protein
MAIEPAPIRRATLPLTLDCSPGCTLVGMIRLESNCSDRFVSPTTIRLCPVSATPGKEVDLQTVKALLREHALRRISTLQHHFCADPACEVVYFDEAGVVYPRDDVRVAVWQKETSSSRMIC